MKEITAVVLTDDEFCFLLEATEAQCRLLRCLSNSALSFVRCQELDMVAEHGEALYRKLGDLVERPRGSICLSRSGSVHEEVAT